jgi:hypothetical protein
LRFWMTLVALLALTFAVYSFTRDDGNIRLVVSAKAPPEHHINLVAQVFSFNGAAGFTLDHGTASAELRLTLDATRTMVIMPGTPGSISCTELAEIGKCVVAADLLGDAVLWFAIIPSEPRPSVTLPAIAEIRRDNEILLDNGWVVKRSAVVERNCVDDTDSLAHFVNRFRSDSTTTFNFEKQQIVKVTCTKSPEATTTTVPSTTSVVVGSTVTGGTDESGNNVPASAPTASDSGVG